MNMFAFALLLVATGWLSIGVTFACVGFWLAKKHGDALVECLQVAVIAFIGWPLIFATVVLTRFDEIC